RHGLTDRRHHLCVLLCRAEADDDRGVAGREMELFRDKRRRRSAEPRDERAHITGHRLQELAAEAECLRALVDGPEEQADMYQRTDLVELVFEAGHHAEIAAAAAERPEQVRILGGGCAYDAA